jgi:flagellar biosynthesis protein FliR
MISELNFEGLLAAAVFTGARVSGLMVFCPFLGSDAVPVPVKAGLTLLLTILLHPLRCTDRSGSHWDHGSGPRWRSGR